MLSECLKGGALVRVDFENPVQSGDFEHVQHFLVHAGQFQLSTRLSDDGIGPHQLTDAVTVDNFDARKSEYEFPRSITCAKLNMNFFTPSPVDT